MTESHCDCGSEWLGWYREEVPEVTEPRGCDSGETTHTNVAVT